MSNICPKHGIERRKRVANDRAAGYKWYCPACVKASPSRSQQNQYNKKLGYVYGLTVEQYQKMLQDQEGRCAICGDKPNSRLLVDHNHDTGHVRGLLCKHCNTILGHAHDNPCVLEAATRYLHDYSCEGYYGHKAS